MPAQPVLKNFKNIECRDAILAWDRIDLVRNEQGRPVTRWDGRSMKKDLVTGRKIPDSSAQVTEERYINPRAAAWPQADYIVGNPPFLGKLHLRTALGGKFKSLASVYKSCIPAGADYVMYWWYLASTKLQLGTRRFGLITTNSIRQSLNRRVLENTANADGRWTLLFAIPDHPWVNDRDGAAVRVAMTVGALTEERQGRLLAIIEERSSGALNRVVYRQSVGVISADLTINQNMTSAAPLKASLGIASMGPALGSRGFVLSRKMRDYLLREDSPLLSSFVRPLISPRDLLYGITDEYVLDLAAVSEEIFLMTQMPATYQYLLNAVKPDKEHNRDIKLVRF